MSQLPSPLTLLGEALALCEDPALNDIRVAYSVHVNGYRDCGDHAELPLTNGFWTKVDHQDLELVLKHKCFTVGEGTLYRPFTARAKIKGQAVQLSRFILGLVVGDKLFADHVNYDNLDNRRENLRVLTRKESAQHRRGWHRNDTVINSEFKGVYFRPAAISKPWRAVIKVDGKAIHLGNFSTERAAAQAYDAVVAQYHGGFGEKNFG